MEISWSVPEKLHYKKIKPFKQGLYYIEIPATDIKKIYKISILAEFFIKIFIKYFHTSFDFRLPLSMKTTPNPASSKITAMPARKKTDR